MSRLPRFSGRSALVILLLAAGALASCAQQQETTENSTTNSMSGMAPESSAAAPSNTAAPALTDANIAAIVKTANDADIDNGKAARSTTKNLKVREFAVQMITDHTSLNKQVDDLTKKLNVSPEDNDASRAFKTTADAKRDSLKQLKGTAFDKAYIDAEVAVHEQVLDLLDKTLIPAAQSADLRTLLQNARPIISTHLDHAKQVQQALGATP